MNTVYGIYKYCHECSVQNIDTIYKSINSRVRMTSDFGRMVVYKWNKYINEDPNNFGRMVVLKSDYKWKSTTGFNQMVVCI